jgi:hypothetical protein
MLSLCCLRVWSWKWVSTLHWVYVVFKRSLDARNINVFAFSFLFIIRILVQQGKAGLWS